MMRALQPITEQQRLPSPAPSPQALAWHAATLWMGSRDLRRIYGIDAKRWTVSEETEAPGIPWAAVSTGEALWLTVGEGPEDDRYLRRFFPGGEFPANERIPCPDLTGSYLSYNGNYLYVSQWYKHRILKLGPSGEILRIIDIEAEICGHVLSMDCSMSCAGLNRGMRIGASRVWIRA